MVGLADGLSEGEKVGKLEDGDSDKKEGEMEGTLDGIGLVGGLDGIEVLGGFVPTIGEFVGSD